jgi:hypothetical protein
MPALVAGIHVETAPRHSGARAKRASPESIKLVMPALVAGIHVYLFRGKRFKTWMAGTSPAMTKQYLVIPGREQSERARNP